jgi:hypothetical protein
MIKTKYLIPVVMLLVFVSRGLTQEVSRLEMYPKERVHLFLLVGQSNMAGRGNVEAIDKQIHTRLFALSKDGEWVPAVDPIHYDKKGAGVGLGKSFALEILEENEDIVIGLVPAACGGSPISTWVPGGYHQQTKSYPYDDAISRIRKAQHNGVLKGILWHQGESDSQPELSSRYADNLRQLIKRFRDDLGAETVPFIIGQLGQFADAPWNDSTKKVNEAHISVAAELPGVGFVESDGLTANADNVHFNSYSLREFGRRYAQVYMKAVELVDGDQ